MNLLEKRKIKYKNIVHATSDGASVIVGKHNGVWAKISKYFSLFSTNHDGTHKVNLLSNSVLSGIP